MTAALWSALGFGGVTVVAAVHAANSRHVWRPGCLMVGVILVLLPVAAIAVTGAVGIASIDEASRSGPGAGIAVAGAALGTAAAAMVAPGLAALPGLFFGGIFLLIAYLCPCRRSPAA